MTTPDPRQTGLDPAHILTICNRVAGDLGHEPVRQLISTPGGVRIGAKTRRAAGDMRAELAHIGYRTAISRPRRRWRLHVTGWSGPALDRRLTAMRATIAQLRDTRAGTAAMVISHYRNVVLSLPAQQASWDALTSAERRLRNTTEATCGVLAPRDPTILPADRADALRLRTVWTLEQLIGQMIEEHLWTARRALAHYQTLRRHGTADWASQTAIRQVTAAPDPPQNSIGIGGQDLAPQPPGPATAPPATSHDTTEPSGGSPTKRTPGQQARLDLPAPEGDHIASNPPPAPAGGDPSVRPAHSSSDLPYSPRPRR